MCALLMAATVVGVHAAPTQQMPSFVLQTVDGKKFVMDDHLKKGVILITFFATWCQACAREHPHLEKLYKDYSDKGLLVLGISIDEPGNIAKLRAHVKRYDLTFPILLDSGSQLARQFAPEQALPLGLLIGRDGRIHHTYQGYAPGDEKEIRKDVIDLLGAPIP